MKNTITVTTKGTFTMPVKIREKMGVNKKGDKLVFTYDEQKNRMIIEKAPVDFLTVQKRLAKYTKNKQPLKNVSKYYQTRTPRT